MDWDTSGTDSEEPVFVNVETSNQMEPTDNPSLRPYAEYSGNYLYFGISEFGEIMPYQYPMGTEHLRIGSYRSGYTVAYRYGGSDHVAYAGYDRRNRIVPVSYEELENSADRLKARVVMNVTGFTSYPTSTAAHIESTDIILQITRIFDFFKSSKHINISTDIRNISGEEVTDVVFKSFADWDIDGSYSSDTFDYDEDSNLGYAYQSHYCGIASDRIPDFRDLDGWDDYNRRVTDEDYPVGPIVIDGLEVLHFELGNLSDGASEEVETVYASGDSLDELISEAGFSNWLTPDVTSGTVTPGGSQDVVLTYNAEDMDVGEYTANIVITSNDPVNTEIRVPASLTVNSPPVADAGGPHSSNEGSTLIFDASASSDPDDEVLEYRWDFNNDGVWDTGWSSIPTANNMWGDDWSGTAKVEVSDGMLTDSDTATVTVNNVPPNVNAGIDQTINEGETVTFSGSFTDPGADLHTVTWNFGDSALETGTLSPSHVYVDDGIYTVTLTVTDDDGGVGSDSLIVTVLNVAPSADDKTETTSEDVPAEITLTASDPGNDLLTFGIFNNPSNGTLSGDPPNVTYTPDPDWNGIDSFTYKANDGVIDSLTTTVTITINAVNDPPVCSGDIVSTDEDVAVTIAVSSNDNAGPLNEDQTLTITSTTNGTMGTVVNNGDGTVTYLPEPNKKGPDSFTYTISDSGGLTDTAPVEINIISINDQPVVSTSIISQTVQYSDGIAPVTITATDIDSSDLAISVNLPEGLDLTENSCISESGTLTCTWTLDGRVLIGAGIYDFTFAVNDGELESTVNTTLIVESEVADVIFYEDNPVAVQVASAGGNSGTFNLMVDVNEMLPDLADIAAYPGDISHAQVSLTLQPVGPGTPALGGCSTVGVSGTGYDSVHAFTCSFNDVPVNTYTAELTVIGDYYSGYAEDVLVVYDPSLGFATGGGWFYWPGSESVESGYPGDKTNFGFTMKYNKKGSKVQGSLLLISHQPDGTIYRVKSNALYGLALGEFSENGENYGWSSFSGKSTYLEPGWPDPIGNHEFIVYIEDRNEPGNGTDQFWIEVHDKDGYVIDGMSMENAAVDNTCELNSGNLVVPHSRGR